MEETGEDTGSDRSTNPAASRRKNGRTGSKTRSGKRNGNGAAAKRGNEREVDLIGADRKTRDADLRRLLDALRDLRDGEFDVLLPMSDDPLLAEISDAFNGI